MILKIDSQKLAYRLIVTATLCIFLGCFLLLIIDKQYFFSLLLNDNIVGHFVEKILSKSYIQYANSNTVAIIAYNTRFLCVTLLVLSVFICTSALFNTPARYIGIKKSVIAVAALIVTLFYTVQVVDVRNYILIAEYSIIISTPFLLINIFKHKSLSKLSIPLIKLIIILTFCTHGLFAFGYPYKTPAVFIDMIIHCTGVKQTTAKHLLQIAGILDFTFCFCIIFAKRGSRLLKYSLIYLAIWGLITALGRVLGNYYPDLGWYNVSQFIPETIIRLPHSLIPLVLLLLTNKKLTLYSQTQA